jgi:peroxiredoxin
MKRILLSLMLTAMSFSTFAQVLTPGASLPKAQFYTSDGKVFTTDQFAKGTKSLLMFFDATCEHCQKVAKEISSRSKQVSGIQMYMITQDEQRSIDYFMENFAKPLKSLKNVTVLQDKDHVFIPLFQPKQYPSLYLYGKDRKLILYSSNEKDVDKFFKLFK